MITPVSLATADNYSVCNFFAPAYSLTFKSHGQVSYRFYTHFANIVLPGYVLPTADCRDWWTPVKL